MICIFHNCFSFCFQSTLSRLSLSEAALFVALLFSMLMLMLCLFLLLLIDIAVAVVVVVALAFVDANEKT